MYKIFFKNEKIKGKYIEYDENGNINVKQYYKNDKLERKWITY